MHSRRSRRTLSNQGLEFSDKGGECKLVDGGVAGFGFKSQRVGFLGLFGVCGWAGGAYDLGSRVGGE